MFVATRAGVLVPKKAAGDPTFSNVVALLSFDGANGSTTFTDRSSVARSFSGVNGAQLSTAQSKAGGSSLALAASSSQYITAAASSDFAFPGDFTIEWWSWKSADGPGSYDTVATTDTSNGSGTNGWIIELSATRGLFMGSSGSALLTTSFNPNTSAWEHYAITRQGATIRGFRGGAIVGTGSSSLSIPAVGPFGIGRNASLVAYPYNGYIDEFRIKKGEALYTAAFTPPAAPFPGA